MWIGGLVHIGSPKRGHFWSSLIFHRFSSFFRTSLSLSSFLTPMSAVRSFAAVPPRSAGAECCSCLRCCCCCLMMSQGWSLKVSRWTSPWGPWTCWRTGEGLEKRTGRKRLRYESMGREVMLAKFLHNSVIKNTLIFLIIITFGPQQIQIRSSSSNNSNNNSNSSNNNTSSSNNNNNSSSLHNPSPVRSDGSLFPDRCCCCFPLKQHPLLCVCERGREREMEMEGGERWREREREKRKRERGIKRVKKDVQYYARVCLLVRERKGERDMKFLLYMHFSLLPTGSCSPERCDHLQDGSPQETGTEPHHAPEEVGGRAGDHWGEIHGEEEKVHGEEREERGEIQIEEIGEIQRGEIQRGERKN